MSSGERYNDNLPSPALDLPCTDNRIRGVVSTLYDDVRPKSLHQLERGVFIESHDKIHCLECRENVSSIVLASNRTSRSFQTLHRVVGVESDNQRITVAARGSE